MRYNPVLFVQWYWLYRISDDKKKQTFSSLTLSVSEEGCTSALYIYVTICKEPHIEQSRVNLVSINHICFLKITSNICPCGTTTVIIVMKRKHKQCILYVKPWLCYISNRNQIGQTS